MASLTLPPHSQSSAFLSNPCRQPTGLARIRRERRELIFSPPVVMRLQKYLETGHFYVNSYVYKFSKQLHIGRSADCRGNFWTGSVMETHEGLTACTLGLSTQSKLIFYIHRKITFRDLHLECMVYVASLAAAYNLLQLSRCVFSTYYSNGNLNKSNKYLSWVWICYLLDQVVVYLTFATNSAAAANAILAVTGMKEFQWMKWCNRFTRLCFQVGGAIVCGYVACALMAFLTFIAAFNLFRLYSPQKFFSLKHS
ncbi:hypothetical protein LWI28_008488 [Acer negundo]|uniref:CASP-like protein n=1 Tax=Acer negundo TaxID=4023 RepID=A0AAD5JI52_ACENE|nr:hypothetical protein LWI28_008488 [Acer negundo]